MIRNKYAIVILSLLVIMFSGVNYFANQILVVLIFLILLIIVFLNKPFRLDLNFLYLTSAFFIVFLFQSIVITWISPYYFIRYFSFVLLIPYMLLKFLPLDYNKYIIKIVYILTIIDLIIWLLSLTIPSFDNYLSHLVVRLGLDPFIEKPKSMLLYTYETNMALGIKRFAGFWHEPGAFAVLLGYCLCFNTLIKNTILSKQNLVFFIGLLATFSTTAYLALGVGGYMFLVLFLKRHSFIKIISLPLIILISIYLFKNLDFLQPKVEEQIETQMASDISGTQTSGRFLGFRKSLNVIKTYPFFGRGLSTKTQAEITSAEHTGYGWPGYFARIGIPLSIVLAILFYKAIELYTIYYNANKKWIPIFITLFIILLFSQKHTSTIIFMMIFLTPIAYAKRFNKIIYLRNRNKQIKTAN